MNKHGQKLQTSVILLFPVKTGKKMRRAIWYKNIPVRLNAGLLINTEVHIFISWR